MEKDIREVVRQKYAKAITTRSSCCSSGNTSCCGGGTTEYGKNIITGNLYNSQEIQGLPQDALAASFGCGNPTALAQLNPGEIVLDLGSGAGLDVLLSARRVGPEGKAYGLDMTDEMLAEANRNKEESGLKNVEFLKGHIEEIPLPNEAVDVIISNCVINLSGDKDRVLQEAFRVLKKGGRFAVSDIVLSKPLPAKVQQDLVAWTGCVAGALTTEDYQEKLRLAGFKDIEIEFTRVYDFSTEEAASLLPRLTKDELLDLNGVVASAFIRARKPAGS